MNTLQELFRMPHARGEILTYQAVLTKLVDSDNAARFLAHVLDWWFRVGRRPFYKFNEPCGHHCYREGDSWLEELPFGRHAFRSARNAVATKITTGTSKNEVLASKDLSSLVIYWTEDDRRTYYEVNERLLCQLLEDALGLPVRPAEAPTVVENSADSPSSMKRPEPTFTYSSLFFKEEKKKEKEDVDKEVYIIAKALEAYGVWEVPALEIAYQAHDAGLDVAATLACFEAQVEAACRSRKVEDPVAVATWRMQQGKLTPPKPNKKKRGGSQQARSFLAFMTGDPAMKPAPTAEVQPRATSALHQASTAPPTSSSPEAPETRCTPVGGGEGSPLPDAPPSAPQSALAQFWKRVLVDLAGQMTRATFDQQLRATQLESIEDETYVVSTPNPVARGWLEGRLALMVQQAVAHHAQRPVDVRFVVRDQNRP